MSNKKIILIIFLTFVVCATAAFLLTKVLKGSDDNNDQPDAEGDTPIVAEQDSTEQYVPAAEDMHLVTPIFNKIPTPRLNEKSQTYSLTVSAQVQTDKAYKVEYVLTDMRDSTKVVKRNNDGRFKDIPYAKDPRGAYRLYAYISGANVSGYAYAEVPGFDKPATPVPPKNSMSKDELQRLINACDPALELGDHPKVVSSGMRFSVTGTTQKITSFQTLFTHIVTQKWKVSVKEVGYNAKGQVNSAKIVVTE